MSFHCNSLSPQGFLPRSLGELPSGLRTAIVLLVALFCPAAGGVYAGERVLEERLLHLRVEGPREWSEFPEEPDAEQLEVRFEASAADQEQTLRLRQQDVKQNWDVTLNDRPLGRLERDENDMVVYFAVPPDTLVDGENVFRVAQNTRGRFSVDDIRVGEVVLDDRPRDAVLSQATVTIEVVDGDDEQMPLPCRLTVLNADGALQSVGAESDDRLAVRPGVVYTAGGRTEFGLPPGEYTIYAGRGFEYSLDSVGFSLEAGSTANHRLQIRREVSVAGFVASDPHVHTFTHSRHGDATIEERMITLAGEGIELPIAADHNVHVDYEPTARRMKLRQYFTPVIGNEVTTPVGHFNVFPVREGAAPPEHQVDRWDPVLDAIHRTPDVKAVILNHARDLHSGTRPFGPEMFNDAVGENLDGWSMRFNAMEVINSGATQSDPLQLIHDWMTLLNRGRRVTPVGASDSHDVARHFVGQGRTYIRCDDSDPGRIDVEQAVYNFVQGRVLVSYGLIAELTVDGKYGPGELAMVPDDEVDVAIRVLGPHWTEAEEVRLYANGTLIESIAIDSGSSEELADGVQWSGRMRIPRPAHDVFLAAVALGKGIDGLYWHTAKPYQPTSPDWTPRTLGLSGAVRLDADGDGRWSSAYDYARRIHAESGGDISRLTAGLADYDSAVAAQAAHLFQTAGGSLLDGDVQAVVAEAAPETVEGFRRYLDAWRKSEQARAVR